MTAATPFRTRPVARVTRPIDWGPDAQTDRKRIVIMPERPELTDPFLSMAEDWFSAVGFDWHPHRGFETVTLVLDGAVEHRDSTGAAGLVEVGDVQWMTAGSGVLHQELAAQRRGTHMLQLWVNLPARLKGVPPAYRDLRGASSPQLQAAGVSGTVYAGTLLGSMAGTGPLHDTALAMVEVAAHARVVLDVPDRHRAFGFVLTGSLAAGEPATEVGSGHTFWVDPALPGSHGVAVVGGSRGARVLVASGRPHREPVAQHGPFVMSTEAELEQAVRDYWAGRFGSVPTS
jgi:hypothetical protein